MIEIGQKGTQLKVSDVLNSKLGSIRLLKEKYSEKDIDDMIIYFITDLISFFNVARPMTSNQIFQTKNIILESYPFFTPEDFSRCFFNIKAMKYGAIYEGLDGGKILTFMQKYEEDFLEEQSILKRNIVEKQRDDYQQELKKTGEYILPVLKSVVEKLDKPKEIKYKPIREQTENEKLLQSWFVEFDKEYAKKPYTKEPFRTIVYKKRMVTQEDFINIKLEEHEKQVD